MRARVAGAVALVVVVGLSGCGGGGGGAKNTAPALEQALPFADSFVHRLVVVGRWQAVADDVTPLSRRALHDWQTTIKRNGVRRIVGGGSVSDKCPKNPVVASSNECIVYHLVGGYVIPISGQHVAIKARFRIWLERTGDRWRLLTYDYEAKPSYTS